MSTTEKLDLFKQHASDYIARKSPVLVKPDKARYLAVEGRGAPEGPVFQSSMEALYAVVYTVKMASKAGGRDYVVPKMEAQWWLDSGHDFEKTPREHWNWRLLIRTPPFITEQAVQDAAGKLEARGRTAPVRTVRLVTLEEGTCVQILHLGPYDQEGPSIERMHDFAAGSGYEFHGRHHEIYLSDPRRTAPSKLRTLLRMPVRK